MTWAAELGAYLEPAIYHLGGGFWLGVVIQGVLASSDLS